MELTIDLLSTEVAVATLGMLASESLKKDKQILFYVDEEGFIRAVNTYTLNLLALEETQAIKVLNALGRSKEEIINFLRDRQQLHIETEKTGTAEVPSAQP
jgi:hypothetical protein